MEEYEYTTQVSGYSGIIELDTADRTIRAILQPLKGWYPAVSEGPDAMEASR